MMINTRNNLGTRGSQRTATAFGIALAIAALALLARDGLGQEMAEPFDLVGTVVDADNGQALVGAWVAIVGSKWGSVTNDRGMFEIPDVGAGPISLAVEQLGYETLEWEGDVQTGLEPLELRLAPEPFVLEGLQVVTDRFRSRRNAIASPVHAYDKAALTTTAQRTALEFITQRSGSPEIYCAGRRGDRCLIVRGRVVEPVVYIDESRVLGGLGYLDTFAPHDLYMVEVYGGGRHIRAYTPRFMERAAKTRLTPIALLF